MPQASIRDVAKETGVSAATVSNVLNGHSKAVGEKTRAKVLQAVRKLRYRPGAPLYGQNAKSTKTVGVVMAHTSGDVFEHPYFTGVLGGILSAVTRRQWNTLLFTVPLWRDVHRRLRTYCDGRCDGLLLLTRGEPVASALVERGFPCVLINAGGGDPRVCSVDVNNAEASASLTRHLIDLGHRRIALFPGNDDVDNAIERIDGFRAAMAAARLDVEEDLVLSGYFHITSGRERADILLRRPRERMPTAIVCGSDQIAIGAIEVLKAAGLRVPQDISIVGFDDLPGSDRMDPPLTTAHQPLKEMGGKAVELLIDHAIKHPDAPRKLALKAPIVHRASVAPPRP